MKSAQLRPALVALLAACALWLPASADIGVFGAPPWWFSLRPAGNRALDGTLRLVLDVGGLTDRSTMGHVRLGFPPGLRVRSAPIEFDFRPGEADRPYTYVITPRVPGRFAIRGWLTIHESDGAEERGEIELRMAFSADSVRFEPLRVIREERYANRRRYRYGGGAMVPLSPGEPPVCEDEILQAGRKPVALERIDARCPTCPGASWRDSVRWVMFIDDRGKIRETSRFGCEPVDTSLVAVTAGALRGWAFAPAEVNGQRVSDWLAVWVRVRH